MAKAKLNIGLTDKQREGVLGILKATLADEVVLHIKTRNFHWNVTGPQFHDLHKFFESQYEQLDEFLDDVAERSRSLGGEALGSMAGMLKHARLKEHDGKPKGAMDMVAELLGDHEALIRNLRKDLAAANDDLGDAGTGDFLTGLMEEHEKMAWMLRSMVGK